MVCSSQITRRALARRDSGEVGMADGHLSFGRGTAREGRAVRGLAWQHGGQVRLGLAWRGQAGEARARHCWARSGMVRPGMARLGAAWYGMACRANYAGTGKLG